MSEPAVPKVVYLYGCPQCLGRLIPAPYRDDRNNERLGALCTGCGLGWNEDTVRAIHFNRKTATVGGI